MARLAKEQAEWRRRKKEGIPGWVDPTETHRQIRALAAAGWTAQQLADRLGWKCGETLLQVLQSRRVLRTTREQVSALYVALENVPGPSERARVLAAGKGWAVPFAWDPETIADPEAKPNTGESRRTLQRRSETLYEYQCIRDSGMSHEYALKELGITQSTWNQKYAARVEK